MNQIGRKYSWFDPKSGSGPGTWPYYLDTMTKPDCTDCSTQSCYFLPCAQYDADGDRIVPVHIAASGNIPAVNYYKKNGTEDTFAKEPYTSMTPCCYSVEINGVANNSVSESWCKKCPDLNKVFYGNFEQRRDILDDPSDYTVHPSLVFSLCNLDDVITLASGDLYPQSIHPPCYIYQLVGGVFLENSGTINPDIVAAATLLAQPFNGEGSTRIDDRRHVQQWKKVLGQYNGNWYESGNNIFPSGTVNYGDMGDFDCTDLIIEFDSSNLVGQNDPKMLTGLCDFSNATIKLAPITSSSDFTRCDPYRAIERLTTYGEQHLYGGSYQVYDVNFLCKGVEYVDQVGNIEGWTSFISNAITVNIQGVIGIDDNLEDSELTIKSCKKCLNDSEILILDDGSVPTMDGGELIPLIDSNMTIKTILHDVDYLHSLSYVHTLENIESCCACYSTTSDANSACIIDVLIYFTIDSTPPTYNIFYITVDFIDSNNQVIARFRKSYNIFMNADWRYELNLDCNNLTIDSFEYIEEDSIAHDSEGWQRCDFSNAEISITFDSYDKLGVDCELVTPLTCGFMEDSQKVRHYSVDIPTTVWKTTYQPFSGEYVLSHGTGLDLGGSPHAASCSWVYRDSSALAIGLSLHLVYDGMDVLDNEFQVSLSMYYYNKLLYIPIMVEYISDIIYPEDALNIRDYLRNYRISWPWPYINSKNVDGIVLHHFKTNWPNSNLWNENQDLTIVEL